MEINRMNSFQPISQGAGQVKQKETEQKVSDQVDLGSQKAEIPVGEHKKWLFMNYIGADCNLKEFQADNIDNQELVGSDKNTHIVAMIDVGPGRDMEVTETGEEKAPSGPSTINWAGARTFYVTQDATPKKLNSPVLEDYGMNVNMAKPETLTKFIVDMMAKFPSDHVGLVLNDHGGGFTGAIADDTQGGFMSTPQIKQALADAEKITGKKIDILGFDACLMAAAEVAHELKDTAKILLASEETEGGPGWTYDSMLKDGTKETPKTKTEVFEMVKKAIAEKKLKTGALQSNKSMSSSIEMLQNAMTKKIDVSPEEFAKIVVKVNEQHNNDIPTFSATDLTKMDGLTKATDELSKAILNTENKTAVKDAIMQAENYGGWQQPQPYADMRDLHHVAELLEKGVSDPKLKEAALNVKKAISEAVIANESDPEKYPNSKGLSIYAPTDSPGGPEYKYGNLQFARDTNWSKAMASLGNVPSTNPKTEEGGGITEAGVMQLVGALQSLTEEQVNAMGEEGLLQHLSEVSGMSVENVLMVLMQVMGGGGGAPQEGGKLPDGSPAQWYDGSPRTMGN
jgi:hypothetical protein